MKKKKKHLFYSFVEEEKCQRDNKHNVMRPPTHPFFSPVFVKGNPEGFAGHWCFAQKL